MATTTQLQTPAWLIATLKGLFSKYHEIAQAHSTNNGLLIAQDRSANAITNATVRAQVKARIQSDVKRQALIAGALRTLYSALVKGRDALAGALRLVGFSTADVVGLADDGMGIVITLPIAVGLGIAAAGVTAAILWNATQVQRQTITNNKAIIDRVLAGQLPLPDALALIDANNKAADQSKDFLGLKSMIGAITPVVGLIVAALVLPPILRMLEGIVPRRAAA